MTIKDDRSVRACLGLAGLARTEKRLLLEHVIARSHSWMLAHDDEQLSVEQYQQYLSLVARRQQGEPVAYLLGSRGFWDFEVRVTPDVLIPRHETECLVEVALEFLREVPSPRVLDMGTGSGVVAIAIARARADVQVTATDISDAALALAQDNARQLQAPVTFVRSDWYAQLQPSVCFDMIVSNPPYIHPEDVHLRQGDLRYEPSQALTDGYDGLAAIRKIVTGGLDRLVAGGSLWLEHGFDQGAAVRACLTAAGYEQVQTRCDLASHERVSGGIAPAC